MHCRSCELLLEQSIGSVQGVTKVKVDYRKGCAIVDHGCDVPSRKELVHAVRSAGYEVGTPGKLPWLSKSAEDWRYIAFGATVIVVAYYALRGTGLLDISLDESNVTLGFALMLGLVAGISSCMALIGGLVLGVAARHAELHPEATSWQKFRPHLFFNGGRVLGYAILGGLLGLLGSVLQISGGFLAFLTLGVGFVMVVLGLKLTNLSPRIAAKSFTLPPSIARFLGISTHQKEYSPRAAMTTGALTFFLPCGFTQAMQLYAVSTGDFKTGALIMGAFALGTAPALLGIGGLSSVMKSTAARVFYAVVGMLVIVFGAYNIKGALAVIPITFSGSDTVISNDNDVPTGDEQIIRMTQTSSGYSPAKLRVKAGQPVRWIITSESSFTCASSLVVPSLGIRTNLKKGENIIEFTPTQKGTIPYSCSMGMYRGTIIVE